MLTQPVLLFRALDPALGVALWVCPFLDLLLALGRGKQQRPHHAQDQEGDRGPCQRSGAACPASHAHGRCLQVQRFPLPRHALASRARWCGASLPVQTWPLATVNAAMLLLRWCQV